MVEQLPPPGLHRLNRAEYGNAARICLRSTSTPQPLPRGRREPRLQPGRHAGSPALLEAYLSAAGKITRRALGRV
jgi:hypothetical protein